MNHILIAVVLQVVVGLTTGHWWVGAALGLFFFAGREIAQAEYRWIETYGQGKRANMPVLGGFDRRVWNGKSLRDVFSPAIVVVCVAVVATLIAAGFFTDAP